MSRLTFNISCEDQRLLVDGNIVGGTLTLDFKSLVRSVDTPGEYFFFTCGCGEAGCAGICDPTEVEHDGAKILWHVIEPEPEQWFTFDRWQYKEAIRTAINDIYKLLSNKSSGSIVGPYGTKRSDFEELKVFVSKWE